MKRVLEWMRVVKTESGRLPVLTILKTLLAFWRWRSRRESIQLLRLCFTCPVYNRRLHQCRPWPGSVLGCGCHMPTKIRFGGGCWLVDTGQTAAAWGPGAGNKEAESEPINKK
jgi:hypothetical protein